MRFLSKNLNGRKQGAVSSKRGSAFMPDSISHPFPEMKKFPLPREKGSQVNERSGLREISLPIIYGVGRTVNPVNS